MKVEKRLGVEAGGKEEKENTTRVSLVWRSVVVCSSETHFGGFGSIAVQLPEREVSSPVSCFLNSALEFKWGPGKYPLGGKIPRAQYPTQNPIPNRPKPSQTTQGLIPDSRPSPTGPA